MHGNVFEWNGDCYHDSYKDAPDDGTAWLEKNGSTCGRRVLRGGSWVSETAQGNVRSAHRGKSFPFDRDNNIGFRVVCSFASGATER
jgi:formylglycine-generating enzyme required for sulfatase activity